MFHSLKLALTLFTLGSGCYSSATLIDSFRPVNHAQDLVLQGPNMGGHTLTGSFAGTMLGGERDVQLSQDQNTADEYAQTIAKCENLGSGTYYEVGAIGPGALGGQTFATAILQYDGSGDEVGNTGMDHILNNVGAGNLLFDGSEGGIRLWFRQPGAEGALTTTVILRRQGVIVSELTLPLDGTSSVQSASFPFASAALSQTDSLSIVFRPLAAGFREDTVYLDHIDTMLPEPTSALPLLGGIGCVFVLQRRVRK